MVEPEIVSMLLCAVVGALKEIENLVPTTYYDTYMYLSCSSEQI